MPNDASQADIHLLADDLIPDRAVTELEGDRLNHRPIAERVADLVTSAETPANVALFAPWGAGKSSFGGLLGRALQKRGADVGYITYNAWSFGGESLQRNFIANTARARGLTPHSSEGRRYFGGLTEKHRSARIDLSRRDLGTLLGIAAVWIVIFMALLLVVMTVVALVAGQDIVATIGDSIPKFFPTAGVTALLVAVITIAASGARVDVEQGAPTQEELRLLCRM